jgi:hypothetical protein
MLSIKMILCHELGHIFNGHLQYALKNSNYRKFAFTMNNVKRNHKSSKSTFTRQALEYDADFFASGQVALIFETDILNNTIINETLSEKDLYKLLGYAIHIVFFLIGLKQNNYFVTKDSINYTHPPVCVRESLFIDSLYSLLNNFSLQKAKYIMEGIVGANQVLCMDERIENQRDSVYVITENRKYNKIITDKWLDIKERLIPFAYYNYNKSDCKHPSTYIPKSDLTHNEDWIKHLANKIISDS